MRTTRRLVVTFGLAALFIMDSPVAEGANLSSRRVSPENGEPIRHRTSAETKNFSVFSFPGGPDAERLAQRAEDLLDQLRARWLEDVASSDWAARCQVVIHEFPASYMRSVGRFAAQTKGSSLIRSHRGNITLRRVDLLASDAGAGEPSAFAHELTHVVLADRFHGDQPPRWMDEGIAMLSDSGAKLALHRRDCIQGLLRGENLPLVEVLTSQELKNPQRIGAFYGQSLTVVELLVRRCGPKTLLAFSEVADQSGYDAALRQCYGLDGIAELEHVWREEMLAMSP
jgi:hypothetical protein